MNNILEAVLLEKQRREKKKLEENFHEFVQAAWHLVEPGSPFMDGLHIQAICEHVQACLEGDIKKLLINVPPRHTKSTLISVMLTPWVWTTKPEKRFLYASYAAALAQRDSVRARRIIESDWYKERWPHVVITDDTNTKAVFENTKSGVRACVSTSASTTGLGGDLLIIDDPMNAIDADSDIERENVINWYKEAFSTRANSSKAISIVLMQRLHEQDLSGYLLTTQRDDWDHLCLPFEKEDGEFRATSLGWLDPRSVGQVLWPERFDDSLEIDMLKRTLGPYGVSGQLQQRPVPRGGGLFKAEWLKFWYDEDQGIPDAVTMKTAQGFVFECPQQPIPKLDLESKISSWDLSFKESKTSDFVVGQMWAREIVGPNVFLLKQYRSQAGFSRTKDAMIEHLYGEDCNTVLVEDKANGAAIIDTLRNEVPGLVAVDPRGGKMARASAVESLWEAGNVWIPHPAQFPWVELFIKELLTFPKSANDDQVDAMSQALVRMLRFRQTELDMGATGDSLVKPAQNF